MQIMTPVTFPESFPILYLAGLGLLVAWCSIASRRRRDDPLATALLLLAAVGGGLIGSRLWMAFASVDRSVMEGVLAPHSMGRNLLGMLLGGGVLTVAVLHLLRCRTTLPQSLAVALPLAVALGRVGCFLAGCCHGLPCDLPWAVQYPAEGLAAVHQWSNGSIGLAEAPLPVHPVQAYEALFALLLAFGATRILPRMRSPYAVLAWMGAAYSMFRLCAAFYRDSSVQGVDGLLPLQWGLLVAAVALATSGVWLERRASAMAPAEAGDSPDGRRVWLATGLLVPAFGMGAVALLTPIEQLALAVGAVPLVFAVAERLGWHLLGMEMRCPVRPRTAFSSAVTLAVLLPTLLPAGDRVVKPDHVRVQGSGGWGLVHFAERENCSDTAVGATDQFRTGGLSVEYDFVENSNNPIVFTLGAHVRASSVERLRAYDFRQNPGENEDSFSERSDENDSEFRETSSENAGVDSFLRESPMDEFGWGLHGRLDWGWAWLGGGLFPLYRSAGENTVQTSFSIGFRPLEGLGMEMNFGHSRTSKQGFDALLDFYINNIFSIKTGVHLLAEDPYEGGGATGWLIQPELRIPLGETTRLLLSTDAVIGNPWHEPRDIRTKDHSDQIWFLGLSLGVEQDIEH